MKKIYTEENPNVCEWYGLLTYNKVYTHQLSLSAHISMFQLLLHRSFNFTKCFLISNNASNGTVLMKMRL